MSVEEFVCYPCQIWWHDKYVFWRSYQSLCPGCGKSRPAVRDITKFADQQVVERPGFDIDGPIFEFEESGVGKTHADLEAERAQIHDEIVESLGIAAAEAADIDTDVEGAGADSGDAADGAGGDL